MQIKSNTPLLSFESAVWIFGGYPQKAWNAAVKILELKIRFVAKAGEISPTSLWILGRRTFGKEYKFI